MTCFFLQSYPLLLGIVKKGAQLGLQECRNQFKNEIWNCTLDNKHVLKELPIFVKTTLPYGKSLSVEKCSIVPYFDVKALDPSLKKSENNDVDDFNFKVTACTLGIYGTSVLTVLKKSLQ